MNLSNLKEHIRRLEWSKEKEDQGPRQIWIVVGGSEPHNAAAHLQRIAGRELFESLLDELQPQGAGWRPRVVEIRGKLVRELARRLLERGFRVPPEYLTLKDFSED